MKKKTILSLVRSRLWQLGWISILGIFALVVNVFAVSSYAQDTEAQDKLAITPSPSNSASSPSSGLGNETFQDYYDQVYQIRVVSPKAGSKSSIGSGFQVSSDGLIVTNYHVISSFAQAPANHKIEYQSHTGQKGDLELLDFDVINDLAILRHSSPSSRFLGFSDTMLSKGETVYALGNPRDYGTSLVKGPNNGMVEHSYNEQILFSGSLNPGMSGGPAVNALGKVVGVNVATAGSQLSFLVPANNAIQLVNAGRTIPQADYQNEIARQIKQWQRPRIQQLLDNEWPAEQFAGLELFGEIRKDFQCWGQTNESNKERDIASVSKSCRAGNSLYLDASLTAGELYFSFDQSSAVTLGELQFTSAIRPWMSANNTSNYEHSSNYRCHVDFLQGRKNSQQFVRATTCIRSFKKLVGLYDSLLMIERIDGLRQFVTHLSVSAIEADQISLLNRKFIERSL
jgi:serine protease Do